MRHGCIFIAISLLAPVVLAQDTPNAKSAAFDEGYRQARTQNQPEVRLEIATTDKRTQYRIGEPIGVALRFTTTAPVKFRIWMISGRWTSLSAADVFHVDPQEGTSDPLTGYRSPGGAGYSGPPPHRLLDADGLQSAEELNEWIRFDRPGKYRVYLEAPRLLGADASPGMMARRDVSRLYSNILELEILPADPEWIRQQLVEASAVLDNRGSSTDEKSRAIRSLRNIPSEKAAQILLAQLPLPQENPGVTGALVGALVMTPYRSLVVDEVKQLSPDPKNSTQAVKTLQQALDISTDMPPSKP